jgi:hypothetical protein
LIESENVARRHRQAIVTRAIACRAKMSW